MPKINRYVDISTIDKEAKKDYIDRHSPFIHCADTAKKGEPFKVTVRMGNEYKHPDDFDHYIAWISLFNGETELVKAEAKAGSMGGAPANWTVDFYIVPTSNKLKLVAQSYCTKHGIWESDPKEVTVTE